MYSARIFDKNNSAPVSRVIEAIYWAMERKVNIINMSFGTTTDSQALRSVIQAAYDQGILIVAAAGNNGSGSESTVEYPAAYNEVIAVGSVNNYAELSGTSSTGEQLDLVAPGELIQSTGAFGGVVVASGTSIASPHVTGVASLLWERDLNCSNAFIRDLLLASANKLGEERYFGEGLVDVAYAMEIYDEFKEKYVEGEGVKKSEFLENTEEIRTIEGIDYVEGSWITQHHEEAVLKDGQGFGLTGMQIQCIKAGAVLPDDPATGLKTDKYGNIFHGMGNYMSYYRYLTIISMEGIDNINPNTAYSGTPDIDRGFVVDKLRGVKWNNYINSLTTKKKNLVIFGISLHCITDAFAHRSYAILPGTNSWFYLASEGMYEDNKDAFPGRYEDAVRVVDTALSTRFYFKKYGRTTEFQNCIFYQYKMDRIWKYCDSVERSIGYPLLTDLSVKLKNATINE